MNMKKIIIIPLLLIICILGNENIKNTPTNKVEGYFKKYQTLNKNVIKNLETVIMKDKTMSNKQKNKYEELIKKQYQNLIYKIKSEQIEKQTATVESEIEVLDYKSSLKNSIEKYQNYFKIKNNKYHFIDYKLSELNKVTKKKKYKITFHLKEKNGLWNIEELETKDLQKIHGLY